MNDDLAVRTGPRLVADPRRVITKLFVPGEETPHSRSRARAVIERVLALDENEAIALARTLTTGFGARHRDLARTLSTHFAFIAHDIAQPDSLSADRQALIGACFTHEYSTEGAALCNPSMAAHPDQSNLDDGQLRFVMMVRCIGEGHISSIGFRTGVVGPGHAIVVDEPAPHLVTGVVRPALHQKALLLSKMAELGDNRWDAELLVGPLPDTFTQADLDTALARVHEHSRDRERIRNATEHVRQIVASHYDLQFEAGTALSERLLWPTAAAESHGMEDARLVRLDDTDGPTYRATYTAYDGAVIDTRTLSTKDFLRFEVRPTAGKAARNKGMALFPRQVGGRYYALSRWDRESLALAQSADLQTWDHASTLYRPRDGWDLIQTGNGGSPIETAQGWLVITHGVGPMRSYGLGAILLDLDDPAVVLATLPGPLLTPASDERDGYVPNVVYTCGALVNGQMLTIPYGISDGSIGFAQVALPDLLGRMVKRPQ